MESPCYICDQFQATVLTGGIPVCDRCAYRWELTADDENVQEDAVTPVMEIPELDFNIGSDS